MIVDGLVAMLGRRLAHQEWPLPKVFVVDGGKWQMRAAQSLLKEAGLMSEYGVYMTKLGMWLNVDAPSIRHAIELENRTQVLGTFTGNMTEAGQAFREKRAPVWKPM